MITDEGAGLTGTVNAILEKWSHVSKAFDARTDSGDNNYYVDALYNGSEYVFWMDHNAAGTNWGAGGTGTTFTNVIPSAEDSLGSGTNDYVPTNGEKIAAYDLFDNDQLPVSLMIAGPGDATHITNLIDIAEKRKDLVVFASPERSDVVGVSNSFTQTNNVRNFFLNLASTSYAMFDSGYKKMYDKYNDQYRYIPLNGDTAGCTANAELVAEAWFSPAGLNRGNIRSAVGLAYNPSQTQRDTLYRNRVNPVCSFPGEGTLLWGDKTALARNSAFNRINVRRLFNFIEDAIERAAKAVLFEFNDEFTREQFVGMVEPFLRDVQGRRGITDFQVVCDETNNTGQVIDANEMRADIYIKPARSINFITLTFVATRTGVDFADVIG
jgi:phage tail sheath protein FI